MEEPYQLWSLKNSQDDCAATQEFVSNEIPSSQKPSHPRAWGRLVSLVPDYGHVDLVTEELTVGRNRRECTVTFTDLRISARHCRLFRSSSDIPKGTSNEIFLEDLSSNGTFLNGKKLGKGKRGQVKNGDEISLVAKRKDTDCIISYIFQDLSVDENEVEEEHPDIAQHYDIRDILGTGSFSVVKLGINRETGEKRAIKIINKKKYWQTNTLDQVAREIEILKRLKHKNIISIIEIYETTKFLYIVLELATGGELFDRIIQKGSLSEDEARLLFKQMLDAVNYLHQQGIAHRDLKPENILLEKKGSMTIKITDFGLARLVGELEMMTTLCGTPQYVAPEIIIASLCSPEQKYGYGVEVDSWSLGAILYVLLSGTPPFDDERECPLFEQIQTGDYSFPDIYWKDISFEAIDLIKGLLTVDPKKRFTVAEALNHPWIKPYSTDKKNVPSRKLNNITNLQKQKIKSVNQSPIKVPASHFGYDSGSDTEDEADNLKIKSLSLYKRKADQHPEGSDKKVQKILFR